MYSISIVYYVPYQNIVVAVDIAVISHRSPLYTQAHTHIYIIIYISVFATYNHYM